jgi:hypothetical protein
LVWHVPYCQVYGSQHGSDYEGLGGWWSVCHMVQHTDGGNIILYAVWAGHSSSQELDVNGDGVRFWV